MDLNHINNTYSISVQQELPRFGDQVYHEQVLDIAIYDSDCKPTVFQNLRIKAEARTSHIIDKLATLPSAILINANNKGYARVILDSNSLKFFLRNLSKVEDDINRCNIWRVICDNMKLGLVSAKEVINCICDHIIPELEEFTLPVVLASAQWIIKYKLGRDEESQKLKKKLYEAYFTKLSHCKTKSMEVLILQELLSLLETDM